MSYRIWLHYGEDKVEIRDETPINKLKCVEGTEKDEYPDYIVGKEDMLEIIMFYRSMLHDIAKERHNNEEKRSKCFMFWYGVMKYFEPNDYGLIANSDSFLLQYFYLVKLYEETNRDKTTLKITHG